MPRRPRGVSPNASALRQMKQLQERLARARKELEELTVEATAGGGAVRAVVTGGLRLRAVEITPEVVDPEDVELLEDLVAAAVNEALEKAQALQSQQLSPLAGGLGLPGLL